MNKSEVADMAQMKQGLKDLGRKVDDHVIEQREDFKLMFKKLDDMNGKFAGKWVEKLSVALIVTTLTAVLGLVISGIV